MLERTDDGWTITNMRDAAWIGGSPGFGRACRFETEATPFADFGLHVFVLEPGKPNCRYHRESVQEGFLVLHGRCRVILNDEERRLDTWDYVHVPAGVDHVFVGGWGEGDDGPCGLLAVGARREGVELFYPHSELAAPHGAQSPEPTSDPRVAYGDVERPGPVDAGWPLA